MKKFVWFIPVLSLGLVLFIIRPSQSQQAVGLFNNGTPGMFTNLARIVVTNATIGVVTNANGETTAGAGYPYQESANANAQQNNATGSSGFTSFYTLPTSTGTGEYQINEYVTTRTSGTSGTFTLSIEWTDEYGLHTNVSPTLTFAGGTTHPYVQATFFVHAVGNTTFAVSPTFNSAIGSPAVDWYIRTLRLN